MKFRELRTGFIENTLLFLVLGLSTLALPAITKTVPHYVTQNFPSNAVSQIAADSFCAGKSPGDKCGNASYFSCNENLQCKLNNGQNCGGNGGGDSACVSGICIKDVCRAQRNGNTPPNNTCDENDDCASNICVDGICYAEPLPSCSGPNCPKCGENADCASGNCANNLSYGKSCFGSIPKNCGTKNCSTSEVCIGSSNGDSLGTFCLAPNTGGPNSYCGKPNNGGPSNEVCGSGYCNPSTLRCAANPNPITPDTNNCEFVSPGVPDPGFHCKSSCNSTTDIPYETYDASCAAQYGSSKGVCCKEKGPQTTKPACPGGSLYSCNQTGSCLSYWEPDTNYSCSNGNPCCRYVSQPVPAQCPACTSAQTCVRLEDPTKLSCANKKSGQANTLCENSNGTPNNDVCATGFSCKPAGGRFYCIANATGGTDPVVPGGGGTNDPGVCAGKGSLDTSYVAFDPNTPGYMGPRCSTPPSESGKFDAELAKTGAYCGKLYSDAWKCTGGIAYSTFPNDTVTCNSASSWCPQNGPPDGGQLPTNPPTSQPTQPIGNPNTSCTDAGGTCNASSIIAGTSCTTATGQPGKRKLKPSDPQCAATNQKHCYICEPTAPTPGDDSGNPNQCVAAGGTCLVNSSGNKPCGNGGKWVASSEDCQSTTICYKCEGQTGGVNQPTPSPITGNGSNTVDEGGVCEWSSQCKGSMNCQPGYWVGGGPESYCCPTGKRMCNYGPNAGSGCVFPNACPNSHNNTACKANNDHCYSGNNAECCSGFCDKKGGGNPGLYECKATNADAQNSTTIASSGECLKNSDCNTQGKKFCVLDSQNVGVCQ